MLLNPSHNLSVAIVYSSLDWFLLADLLFSWDFFFFFLLQTIPLSFVWPHCPRPISSNLFIYVLNILKVSPGTFLRNIVCEAKIFSPWIPEIRKTVLCCTCVAFQTTVVQSSCIILYSHQQCILSSSFSLYWPALGMVSLLSFSNSSL